MRHFSLLFLVTLINYTAQAQMVTSLSETFNGGCAMSTGFPSSWRAINPVSGTDPQGKWTCGPTDGRFGTPGIECTGIWSAAYHLDTSYLISPLFDPSGYTSLFLNFDSKTTNLYGGDLRVIKASGADSTFTNPSLDSDISVSSSPVIGTPSDSLGWVTHHVDMTTHIGSSPFYIAFRFTSKNTSGNIWYLDNVNTATSEVWLGVSDPEKHISLTANEMAGQVSLRCEVPEAGRYRLLIYDIAGRQLNQSDTELPAGISTETVNLNLAPGMYFVKMSNNVVAGHTKFIVR